MAPDLLLAGNTNVFLVNVPPVWPVTRVALSCSFLFRVLFADYRWQTKILLRRASVALLQLEK